MTHRSINIDAVLDSFDDHWNPRILAQVNDWDLRVVKVDGGFVWHAHPETDELFIVREGSLEIGLRDGDGERAVHLGPGDVFVVPKGVEHRPRSAGGATFLLFEPTGTLNTGDFAGERPAHIASTTGRPLVA